MRREMTLRGLLHELTAGYLDLDAPITVDLYTQTETGIGWVTMVVTGVTTRIGPDGKVQALDLVRRGQVEEP